VRILEEHRVRNEDRTERQTDTSLAARLEAFTMDDNAFGSELPRVDVRSSRSFEGDARQEKDSLFEARIAVVVIDVLPNGNMVVAATRVVQIDDETKTLKISGLVRRLDVTTGNTVLSSQVADARVSIQSEGGNGRTVTKGPVGQLFDTLVWAAWPF
jgi:flagellar L-ring protein precursor FlgH